MQPPEDVPTDIYIGTITVEPVSVSSNVISKYGVEIKVAAKADVLVSITGEETLDYDVDIYISDSSGGGGGGGGGDSSTKISISYTNRGNIDVTPQIHVDVWDRDQTRIVKSVDFEGEKVKPTKEGTQEF